MSGRRSAGERGAAAVEFALVVPLLLAVMFGIVDYGLWFGDSLNVRQGVDEGARRAVVKDFGDCSGNAAEQTACVTRERISPLGGDVYVRVSVAGPGGNQGEWTKGGKLSVCAVIRENGLTGLTPMPADGLMSSAVNKRVEVTITGTVPVSEDTLPAGATWEEMCG